MVCLAASSFASWARVNSFSARSCIVKIETKLVGVSGVKAGENSVIKSSRAERGQMPIYASRADESSPSSAKMNREEEHTELRRSEETKNSCRVAVIGAGAAGLVAGRELVREGHDVVVFEKSMEVGGVWIYDPQTESDLLGIDPGRSRVHSSIYSSLRTNLPRELMGYSDFPFLPKDGQPGRDSRRFPGHSEVAYYLKDFAEYFNLLGLIKFGVEVEYVGIKAGMEKTVFEKEIGDKGEGDTKWIVRFRRVSSLSNERKIQHLGSEEEVFDAVVVCSGHYAQPRLADIPGVQRWPGVHMHSHNYRDPDSFIDKVVVIIGHASSGEDIAKEVASLAKEVHICARKWPSDIITPAKGPRENTWLHTTVEAAYEDGSVKFQDGTSTIADVIMHCTGYSYWYPFLNTQGVVSVEDNRVDPVYKHVFVPPFAPTLSFVGLPWKVVPFPMFELQSKWISKVLSKTVELPSESEMTSDVMHLYEEQEAMGIPKSHTHELGDLQFGYQDWLSEQCGHEPLQRWRREMYMRTSKDKRTDNDRYRDVWSFEDVLQDAVASLMELSRSLRISN